MRWPTQRNEVQAGSGAILTCGAALLVRAVAAVQLAVAARLERDALAAAARQLGGQALGGGGAPAYKRAAHHVHSVELQLAQAQSSTDKKKLKIYLF